MTDLIIGQNAYRRDKFFATVWLAKPEELVAAAAMKKMGFSALDRGLLARRLLVSWCQEMLAEGMVGEPLMRIKAELDRLEVSSVALDEAATRLPTPKTKEKKK